jgi:hypothetical protein
MPSTDRKLELKAKTSMAQTASQAAVYAKGLNWSNGDSETVKWKHLHKAQKIRKKKWLHKFCI